MFVFLAVLLKTKALGAKLALQLLNVMFLEVAL